MANTACDKHNFILDFVLGAGNIHDSIMFSGLYEKVLKKFPEMQATAVDAGYKTPAIMKQIIDSGKVPCVPYKRPMTKDGFFKKYDFVYDEHFDCVLCPNNQILSYSTTNRDGYREYKRKTCHALYSATWTAKGEDAGHAYFRVHESEKAGNMEAEKGHAAPIFTTLYLSDSQLYSIISNW